ncbi:MAG: hypothetical protein AABX51_02480 [Nanoarchaeota archaeon]
MTIIVAANMGNEIYFAYDTAAKWHHMDGSAHASFDKVRQVRENAALGIAGLSIHLEMFSDDIRQYSDQNPLSILERLIHNNTLDARYSTSFLLGIVEEGVPSIYAFHQRDRIIKQVQVYGIGSGMYDEVESMLNSVDSSATREELMAHLDATVNFAKALDRERMDVLYGFGSGILSANGYTLVSYERAERERLRVCFKSRRAQKFLKN